MALFTWILPAGQYERAANVALGKDAPVPGTYKIVEATHQGVYDVLMAPISGFYNQNTGMANAIDVSLFVLIIGCCLRRAAPPTAWPKKRWRFTRC